MKIKRRFRVLRLYGPKRVEVKWGRRNLYYEESDNVKYSPNVIRTIQPDNMDGGT